MLIGFSVANFRSFYKTQTISFVASKIKRHKTHISTIGNRNILKSGLIFGANAGGKSNLIKAVNFSKDIIINGLDKISPSKEHFRIKKEALYDPGVFEYRIMIDNVEFSYGLAISYQDRVILGEYLYKIKDNGKEVCLFNREIDDKNNSHAESEFFQSLDKDEKNKLQFYLDGFDSKISDAYRRKTILSDIALRENEKQGFFSEIISVYKWFKNIIIVFPNSKFNQLTEATADETTRELFTKIIAYFDTGIQKIEHTQESELDELFKKIPIETFSHIKDLISNELNKQTRFTLKIEEQIVALRINSDGNIVYDKMLMDHGNSNDLFEYSDESDGTKRLFDLIPLFLLDKNNVKTIFIDEIDRSFHTNLTKKYLELFHELHENENCQIIATSHDVNLIDLDLLRQDEIWFIERQEDHSSHIFSLNKFKERFDKRADKEYILGRYGAIPIFNEDILEKGGL